jgi:hypothetical protein
VAVISDSVPTRQITCGSAWPYGLVHRLNPFFSDVIWVPVGVNMT